jgi:hypothetical protein
MTKSYFILILTLIILSGCSSNKSDEKLIITSEDFSVVKNVHFEEVLVPPVILDLLNLCIVDSFLVVAQARKDTLFHIFSLPECKLLLGFGRPGRGPGEFSLHFANSTFKPVFDVTPKFGIGNRMNNIRYYNILEVLNNNLSPDTVLKLPPKLNGFQTISYIKDSIVIGAPYRGEMHLFKYVSKSNSLTGFRDFFVPFPNMNDDKLRSLYSAYSSLRPDNKRLAVTYARFGRIDLYNLEDGTMKTINYKDFPTIEENMQISRKSTDYKTNFEQKIFSWEIVSTAKHIYCKIMNTPYGELINGMSYNREFISPIFVFDWEGNPQKIIRPDKYYYKFYVDKDDKSLYAIDSDKEGIIYKLDL